MPSASKPHSIQQREKWQLLLPFHWVEIISHKKKPPIFFIFFILMLFPTIVASTKLTVILWPYAQKIVPLVRQFVYDTYPDDLVVNIEKGIVSINQTEPYFIDLPSYLSDSQKSPHLVVFDSKAQSSDFKDYNTLVLVAKNIVYYTESRDNQLTLNEDNKLVSQSNDKLPQTTFRELPTDLNGTLTKDLVIQTVEKILSAKPWATYAKVGVIILAVLLFWASLTGVFFIVFFNSIIVHLVGKLSGVHLKFETTFIYTLACATVLIMTYRIADFFIPTSWSTILLHLRHLLVIGFAYVGLRQLSMHKKEAFSWQEAGLIIAALPVYLAQDLVSSKRSNTKKLAYVAFLLLFIFLPWINFYIKLVSTLI